MNDLDAIQHSPYRIAKQSLETGMVMIGQDRPDDDHSFTFFSTVIDHQTAGVQRNLSLDDARHRAQTVGASATAWEPSEEPPSHV